MRCAVGQRAVDNACKPPKLRFRADLVRISCCAAAGWLRGCDSRLGQHRKQPATDALVQHRKQRIEAFCARNFRLLRFGQRRIGVMGRMNLLSRSVERFFVYSGKLLRSRKCVDLCLYGRHSLVRHCTVSQSFFGRFRCAFGRAFGRILICIASCALHRCCLCCALCGWFCSRQGRALRYFHGSRITGNRTQRQHHTNRQKNTDQLCFHLFFLLRSLALLQTAIFPTCTRGTPTQSAILY